MTSTALLRRRVKLTVPLMLAIVFGSSVVVTAPAADAVTGRRVCFYGENITGENVRTIVARKDGANAYTNPKVKRAVGVNYTKNKKCPLITDQVKKNSFARTFQGPPRAEVSALDCGKWLAEIGASGKLHVPRGDRMLFEFASGTHPGDVCTGMRKDIFYEFNVIIETLPNMVPAVNDFTVQGLSTMTVQDMT
ncbi:hypothetical protein [Amycolatopsis sp. NPDC059657]|uniref:hypothetical protein n=1 Tax=Amycolatopsis sp. NPDC059657 TaxID=3346899 RepID=UPI0036714429